jgi:hypothetical protein
MKKVIKAEKKPKNADIRNYDLCKNMQKNGKQTKK